MIYLNIYKHKNLIKCMKTQFDIPNDLNKLLRIYVIESDKKNREEAILFIITQFLTEMYKNGNK